jgi:hypothetical protein
VKENLVVSAKRPSKSFQNVKNATKCFIRPANTKNLYATCATLRIISYQSIGAFTTDLDRSTKLKHIFMENSRLLTKV